MDLPGTKVSVASCLRMMWLMVAQVRPIQPAMALCRMPSRASAKTLCLISIEVGQGAITKSSKD